MSDDENLLAESLVRPAGRFPTLPSAFRDRVVQAAVRASGQRTRRRRLWLAGCTLLLLSLAGGQMLANITAARWNERQAVRRRSAISVQEEKQTHRERMAIVGSSEQYLTEARELLRKRREIFLRLF